MSWTQGTWHTGEQIRDHKLACSIINLHGTVDSVFDDAWLNELKDFTLNRSIETRDKFLADNDCVDDASSERPGDKAASKGSLHGMLIARYGTDNPALDDRDWELLQEWFEKGMPEGEHVSR